jgi:hypothetical protein
MAPEIPREQEQSIKARKKELFDAETRSDTGPRRRFSEYIRTTDPAPLPQRLRIGLWALGALVLLVFLTALLTIPGPRRKSHAGPQQSVRQDAGN